MQCRVAPLDKHLIRAVQAEITRYQRYQAEYRTRRRYIQSMAGARGVLKEDPVQGGCGGSGLPDAQRIVERLEEDRRLRVLECRIGAIEEGLGILKETAPEIWKVAEMMCVQGTLPPEEAAAEMQVSVAHYYRLRRRMLEQMAPILFGAFGEAC